MDKISALFYKTVEETTKNRSMDLDLSGDRLKRRHDALKGTILIIFRKNIVMMSI